MIGEILPGTGRNPLSSAWSSGWRNPSIQRCLASRGLAVYSLKIGAIARIAFGEDQAAAGELRIEQPDLEQFIGRQGLRQVDQRGSDLALGDIRDFVGRIEQHDRQRTRTVDRTERRAIKRRWARHGRIDIGAGREHAERQHGQRAANEVLAQVSRGACYAALAFDRDNEPSPRSGRRSRGSSRRPARIRRERPRPVRPGPPANPRSSGANLRARTCSGNSCSIGNFSSAYGDGEPSWRRGLARALVGLAVDRQQRIGGAVEMRLMGGEQAQERARGPRGWNHARSAGSRGRGWPLPGFRRRCREYPEGWRSDRSCA